MKIGIVQHDVIWENPEGTVRIIEEILTGNNENPDWLIFPEMTLSGFTMNSKSAEIDDMAGEFFKKMAIIKKAFVTFGVVRNRKNTLITVSPEGNEVFSYAKQHLFSFAGEDKVYSSGTDHLQFEISGFKITPAVCYDLRFTYLFWEKALDTDVYIVIANWPASRREHWKTLLKARAIENQSYVIGVNRIGNDPKLEYSGDSGIYAPDGKFILDCGNQSGCFIVEIDKTKVTETRDRFKFLKDRRK